MFLEGREDAEDEDYSGRPSTSHSDKNVKKVRDLLNSDRRLRILVDECNIPEGNVHRIISHRRFRHTEELNEVGPQEFMPQGQTANDHFELEVLKRLHSKAKCVGKEIGYTWRLHHDNRPSPSLSLSVWRNAV
ncbi:hypothetical protein NPIL_682421 [Nephila pilipes]|uniref:Uncharacterized protein n=1 Tax=Nephila pilipes TaxID=299642 RepID=A0A8X6NT63_NEPPI|nr:hypothetical protein NPIL_682421 [Nephila pilipes]